MKKILIILCIFPLLVSAQKQNLRLTPYPLSSLIREALICKKTFNEYSKNYNDSSSFYVLEYSFNKYIKINKEIDNVLLNNLTGNYAECIDYKEYQQYDISIGLNKFYTKSSEKMKKIIEIQKERIQIRDSLINKLYLVLAK